MHNDLVCSDPRLVKVCTEIFKLLTSEDEEGNIHGIEVRVRVSSRTNTRSAILTVGLIGIQMYYKPVVQTSEGRRGSDEGANVFLTLPFKDDSGNEIRVPCYYSERSSEPTLTSSASSAMRSPRHTGVRRVVNEKLNKPSYTRRY